MKSLYYLLPYRASNEPVYYSKSMLNDILKKTSMC